MISNAQTAAKRKRCLVCEDFEREFAAAWKRAGPPQKEPPVWRSGCIFSTGEPGETTTNGRLYKMFASAAPDEEE